MISYIVYIYNVYIRQFFTSKTSSTLLCNLKYSNYDGIPEILAENNVKIIQNFARLNKCIIEIPENVQINKILQNERVISISAERSSQFS